jgi:release factor glutamine methyltransferase
MAEREATVADALREAANRLANVSDTPRLDAELLLANALRVSRSDMLLRLMQSPVPGEFSDHITRRMGHEPVAYIVGEQEFFGLPFRISPAVLIPRADSETLVDRALAARPAARRVLDCGTGSGALLLAVLAGLPEAEGVGIDRSYPALLIARKNAELLGLSGRAQMLMADWEQMNLQQQLVGRFDLILTNPPYVETGAELAPDVRLHEPAGALFAGTEGLDAYRVLLPQLPALLAPGGAALVEIGARQSEAVGVIAALAGFDSSLHHDLGGRPRVLELVIPT